MTILSDGRFRRTVILGICLFGIAGCGDNMSNHTAERLAKQKISSLDAVHWCLNPIKLKSAKTNELIALDSSPADPFPIIFAEEAFVSWNDQDEYVMDLLIGGRFIAVHSGGYLNSATEKGTPGPPYNPLDQEFVDKIVNQIRHFGALIDLTDRGRSQNVWNSQNGFCLQGRWDLAKVTGWTEPAPDQEGRLVTHIKASKVLVVLSLGNATQGLNPMDFDYTTVEQDYRAAKFNDGWRLIEDDE